MTEEWGTHEFRLRWGIRQRMAQCAVATYQELGEKAGVQGRTVQLAHRPGTRRSTLSKIAQALDCDISQLFLRQGP